MLLPHADGRIDWDAHAAALERTASAGLIPAVNMDTGFVDLLDPRSRAEVLDRSRAVLGPRAPLVAGAFTDDAPGAPFDPDRLRRSVEEVARRDAVPVVFPSWGLSSLPDGEAVAAHGCLAGVCDGFYAFELSPRFAPFGRVWSLEAWAGLLEIPACLGAKHSSLSRRAEWERLAVRDRVRPGFAVLTGNDLAIDMIAWGSDYLLGLATFAPEAFARRDAWFAAGDARWWELNDALQALGAFAFRDPVPAYKHSAAQVWHLRGWCGPDAAHPDAARRPESDLEVLRGLLERIDAAVAAP